MAKHNVYLNLPTREIGKVDAHFYIYKNDEKLGQITISKGGLGYYPYKKKTPITLNWTQLDQLLKEFYNK